MNKPPKPLSLLVLIFLPCANFIIFTSAYDEFNKLFQIENYPLIIESKPISVGLSATFPLIFYWALELTKQIVPKFTYEQRFNFILKHAKKLGILSILSILIMPRVIVFYYSQQELFRCAPYESRGQYIWLKNAELCFTNVSHLRYDLKQWMLEKQDAKQPIALETLIAEKDRLQQDYDALYKKN